MRSFEKILLGKSEDGTAKNSELGGDKLKNASTYEGIWNDTSSLPEQIESDEE